MDKKEKIRKKEILKFIADIEPDHELLVWEKWIKIRKEETEILTRYTNRQPVNLAMNVLDRKREDKERKIALEHAQIEEKPFIRGGLWEQPPRLRQSCYCQPVYEIQRTDAEKGIPRAIEHIGIPDLIKKTEMGVFGEVQRKSCNRLDMEYIKYRDKRENDLKEKITKIDPFRPLIGDLMICGGKPKKPTKKMPLPPTLQIVEASCLESEVSVYAVKINNTIIYKDIQGKVIHSLEEIKKESWHEDCKSWTYYFNVPVSRVGRSKLYLQNLGTVTLRYCWKKIKKTIPFIPDEVYNQVFFFNKNEDVLSPGQNKILYITCMSDKPGIFNETWELSFCNIFFFDFPSEKLAISLNADFVEDFQSLFRNVNMLKSIITNISLANIAKDLLNSIFMKATTVEPRICPYKKLFLESEMFLLKNPVCYYHQTEVLKMKHLYLEMEPGEEWDLSIQSWRGKMINKGYDDRLKYYELLRKSHRELLKPWEEGDNILHQKYKAMNWLLGKMADKFDHEYERVLDLSGVRKQSMLGPEFDDSNDSIWDLDPNKVNLMRHLFYIFTYEHVATTIEMCAGVLSSIDLNRWIDFDFCRS